MDIHENGSENSSGKEDNFVKFFDNITSNSLMDYANEMTKKTQQLPLIPTEMQDAIQLLSSLIFHCMKNSEVAIFQVCNRK